MIFFRNDVAGIVSRQLDGNGVVDIGPAGMMIHFFRYEGYAGHEAESRIEVVELKRFYELVFLFFPHRACGFTGCVEKENGRAVVAKVAQ